MTRLTRYLLLGMLLLPSVALAQWSPTDIANAHLIIDPSNCLHLWQEVGGSAVTQADTAGDPVGIIDEPHGHDVRSTSASTQPILGNDATHGAFLNYDSTGGSKVTFVNNVEKLTRCFHTNRHGWIFARVQFQSATAAANQTLLDQIALSAGSNSIGLAVRRTTAELIRVILADGDGTASLDFSTAASSVAHTNVVEILIQINPSPATSSIQLDDGTPVTATEGDSAPADANASNSLRIGLANGNTSPLDAKLYLLVVGSGALDSDDLTALRAYKPQLNPTGKSKALRTGTGTLPSDHTHLIGWWDNTNTDNLLQHDGTTAVTTADDPVGVLINAREADAPANATFNRNFVQTTEANCPTWQTNQINSLGAPVWAGEADNPPTTYVGEHNLANQYADFTGRGTRTFILVFKQSRTATGAHIIRTSANSSYMVQTGTDYRELPEISGDMVFHEGGGTYSTSPLVNPNPEGLTFVVLEESGTYWRASINGTWAAAGTGRVATNWQHIGRPAHKTDGLSWDLAGSMYELAIFNKLLTQAEINKLVATMATKYAATGIEYPGQGAPRNQRIGIGIGIGLGAVERKTPAQEFLAKARFTADEFSLAP
jgi:hypothetical protein